MDSVIIEENKTKTEEKQKNTVLETAKQELQPSKKSLAWTAERKAKQRLSMIRMQASGKGYKGKNKTTIEEPEIKVPEIKEPEIIDEPEQLEPLDYEDHGINSVTVLLIILLGLIFAGLIFFKDRILNLIGKKDHKDEVNNE